jgi:hypothetical protein
MTLEPIRTITVTLSNLPPEFGLGDVTCVVEWDGGDIYTLITHDATDQNGGDVSHYVDAVIVERAEEKARDTVEHEARADRGSDEIERAEMICAERAWRDS